SLRRHLAGDAGGGHRAADPDLGRIRAHQSGTGDHRYHRRLLSHSGGRHAGPQKCRFQSGRPDTALWRVRLPTALPYLLSGMKTAGGLALIGAVVAEFVAGSGTATGLAWRIVESGNRLEIATLFAALGLLAFTGVLIFAALSLLEWLLLRRWHESALRAP